MLPDYPCACLSCKRMQSAVTRGQILPSGSVSHAVIIATCTAGHISALRWGAEADTPNPACQVC